MNASGPMRIVGILALTALLLVFTGCKAKGPIQFGIYSVPTADLQRAKNIGIDFVVGPRERSYLNAAEAVGLKVIGRGPGLAQHSALKGIYLSDEPDLRGISPDAIRREAARIRRHSKTPLYLNLSSGYSIERFRDNADVLMFDWYPVGWRPPETFFDQCRGARLAARNKRFYAVVQLFSWAAYPKLMPPNSAHRAPTPDEVRAFTVWAVMNGASGIAFYPYDDGFTRLNEMPEIEKAMRSAIALVRDREDYLKGEPLWNKYPFDFKEPRDSTNAVAATSIVVRFAADKKDKSSLLLTAANTTSWTIEAKWDSRMGSELAGRPLTFAPLEVRFFKLRR